MKHKWMWTQCSLVGVLLYCLQVWTISFYISSSFSAVNQHCHVSTESVMLSVGLQMTSFPQFLISSVQRVMLWWLTWSITDDGDNICEQGLGLDFIHHCYQFTHAIHKHTFPSEWRICLCKCEIQIAVETDRNWFCWLTSQTTKASSESI